MSYSGSLQVENRHELVVNGEPLRASGKAVWDAALVMLDQAPSDGRAEPLKAATRVLIPKSSPPKLADES